MSIVSSKLPSCGREGEREGKIEGRGDEGERERGREVSDGGGKEGEKKWSEGRRSSREESRR